MSGKRANARLPRRGAPTAPHLLDAVEYARILRGAGDPAGAARVLDSAFEAEGIQRRPVSDRLRWRALVLRADLALQLDDDVAAAKYLSGVEALPGVMEHLAAGLLADDTGSLAAVVEALPDVAQALAALDDGTREA